VTTIGLALWFAALGHDIWAVREAARERLLARWPGRAGVAVARLYSLSPDPEVRCGADRIRRAWWAREIPRRVDDLLPPDAWCWPDIDHAKRWTDLGILVRPASITSLCEVPVGWPYPQYRRATRQAVIGYLLDGGDWSVAREMVADSVWTERRHDTYGRLYDGPTPRDLWLMVRYAPECLARSRRTAD
jgi:hypothetical protein